MSSFYTYSNHSMSSLNIIPPDYEINDDSHSDYSDYSDGELPYFALKNKYPNSISDSELPKCNLNAYNVKSSSWETRLYKSQIVKQHPNDPNKILDVEMLSKKKNRKYKNSKNKKIVKDAYFKNTKINTSNILSSSSKRKINSPVRLSEQPDMPNVISSKQCVCFNKNGLRCQKAFSNPLTKACHIHDRKSLEIHVSTTTTTSSTSDSLNDNQSEDVITNDLGWINELSNLNHQIEDHKFKIKIIQSKIKKLLLDKASEANNTSKIIPKKIQNRKKCKHKGCNMKENLDKHPGWCGFHYPGKKKIKK